MERDNCFGKLFPDISFVKMNEAIEGEVFSLKVNHQPVSKPNPEIRIDEERWSECFKCKSYQSCYDLSMAKIAFQSAIKAVI